MKRSRQSGATATTTAPVYTGRVAKTGNSRSLRFQSALFQSHPEFNGDVKAQVIGPGRMLVVASSRPRPSAEGDPVLSSFMSFLAQDMQTNPSHIAPLNESLVNEIGKLVSGVKVSRDEDLGDEELL